VNIFPLFYYYSGHFLIAIMNQLLQTCKWYVLTLQLLFAVGSAFAQEVEVSGVVTGADNAPISGVAVSVAGENALTATDQAGRYTVAVPTGITLVFTSIGYQTAEIVVGAQRTINVTLVEALSALDEVVVVGYGTQRKKDLTGAISSIKAEDLTVQGTNTVQKALQGRIAGVQVESSGGSPGSGVRLLIRGSGSLNNTDPLYIVDGVQVDNINNLNPTDIASIDVLKDASAAAIYGSRAANGVVLITTKSGVSGDNRIQFDAYAGVQNQAKKLEVLNARDWAMVNNAAHDNAGLPRLDIAQDPESLGEGTDWQNEVYRPALMQNYSLGVSGGNDKATYSISGGYLEQDGIVKVTTYNRMNLRVKSDYTKGRIKIGETVILSKEYWRNMAGGWGGQGGNPVGSALKMIPVFGVYDENALGGYRGTSGPVVNVANPIAQLNLDVPEVNHTDAIINLFAEVSILDGLTYRFNVGYTNKFGYNYNYVYPYRVEPFFNEDADLREERNQTDFFLQEHTLSYNKVIGKHSVQALAGYTYQQTKFRGLFGSKSGMPPEFSVLDAGIVNAQTGSSANQHVLLSFLSRLVYSFDDRYVITATFRRDGSSRFSPDNRYGNFPSIAAAWNVSNEPFFEALKPTLSTLKLRGSYGELGNQEIPNYQYAATIISNANYVTGIDQHLWSGGIQTAFATPAIRWENTKTVDIGADFGLFDNKLEVTFDYFNRKSSDLLLRVPIPLSTGASGSSPFINAGQITNEGWETALAYNHSVDDFSFQLMGTLMGINNQVDYLGTGTQQIFGGQPTHHGQSSTVTQAGLPVGAFYLIRTAGIFNSVEEVNAHSKDGQLIQPAAKPGDVVFVDANDDGKIDQNDRQYVGSPDPKLSYGFGGSLSWKNIDLNLFFQGTYGNMIYNGMRQDLEGMQLEFNYLATTKNAWTPEKHTAFPRAVINDPNLNSQTSDRFLESGSYLRLRTLQVGYTLPESALSRLKVSNIRLYASFDNLVTFTSYQGFNPDLGRGGNLLSRGVDFPHVAYPLPRTSLFGAQISF